MIWSSWGAPGVFVLLLAWTAAGVTLRAAPQRRMNRLLALLLVLEGAHGAGAAGFAFMVVDPKWAQFFAVLAAVTQVALPLQYLVFLGEALRAPLARPLRSRAVVVALNTLTVAAAAFVLAAPDRFIGEVQPSTLGTWNFSWTPLGFRVIQIHSVVTLFALVVAIQAFRRSPKGSSARGQAAWFIVAFGLRDAFLTFVLMFIPVLRPIPFWGDFIYNPLVELMYAVFVPLLAYAILRYQLFNIDLRVRFALRHGFAGAIIAGGFFVVSEVLESVFPVEGVVTGVVLAIVIATLLKPAQSMAEGIATRLMPNVRDEPDYHDRRRVDIFRAAVEGALQDGFISDDERQILTRLGEELRITSHDAARMEREVRSILESAP